MSKVFHRHPCQIQAQFIPRILLRKMSTISHPLRLLDTLLIRIRTILHPLNQSGESLRLAMPMIITRILKLARRLRRGMSLLRRRVRWKGYGGTFLKMGSRRRDLANFYAGLLFIWYGTFFFFFGRESCLMMNRLKIIHREIPLLFSRKRCSSSTRTPKCHRILIHGKVR